MILLRSKILEELDEGNIVISPFSSKNLGVNSYDVTLHPDLLVYTERILDMDECNPTEKITIPETGFVLMPGELYIGATNETASSKKYVPMFDGRSSTGRLGIALHQTAGIGDVGFGFDANGEPTLATWTMELSVIKPVRVYPYRRVGQVFFIAGDHAPELNELYTGKYNTQRAPQASLSFQDH